MKHQHQPTKAAPLLIAVQAPEGGGEPAVPFAPEGGKQAPCGGEGDGEEDASQITNP